MIDIEKYLNDKWESYRVIASRNPQFSLHRSQCCWETRKDKFYISCQTWQWDCKLCFTPDMDIMTKKWVRKIVDIKIWDLVLTKNWNYKAVTDIIQKQFNGDLTRIDIKWFKKPILCTGDHKIFGIKSIFKLPNRRHRIWWDRLDDVSEIKANEFQSKDLLYTPSINKLPKWDIEWPKYKQKKDWPKVKCIPRDMLKDKFLYWVIWWYIAEWCWVTRWINFAFHIDQKYQADKVQSFFRKYWFKAEYMKQAGKWWHLQVYSVVLHKFFADICWIHALNKNIPEKLMFTDKTLAIIEWYRFWDGHKNTITTISEKLAYNIYYFFNFIWSRPSIYIRKAYIDKNWVNHKKAYTVGGLDLVNWHINWNKDFVKVKEVWKYNYKWPVYDLTVQDEHTYTVNGVAVHNCDQRGNFNSYRKFFGDGGVQLEWTEYKVPKDSILKEYREITDTDIRDSVAKLWGLREDAVKYMIDRWITKETIKYFNIGINNNRLSIPIFEEWKVVDIVSWKLPWDKTDMPKYMHDKGSKLSLLNRRILEQEIKPKEIFITEGTFDALTVYQEISENVVWNVGWCEYLWKDWIELFKGVTRIFILYDTDDAWKKWANALAKFLWMDRCVIINLPNDVNDVNDYFYKSSYTKEQLMKMIDKHKIIEVDPVKHVSDFTEELIENIRNGDMGGIPTWIQPLTEILGGYKKGHLVLLGALTSVWKCVAYDSEILNPITWALVTIEDFVKRKNKYIYSWEYDRIKKSNVLDWIDSGKKEVFEVTTAHWTVCKVTDVHPFLCEDLQWKQLKDLTVGDSIWIPRYYPERFGTENISSDDIRIMAYLIADWHTPKKGSFSWTKADKDMVEDFWKCLKNIDSELIHTWDYSYRIKATNKGTKQIYIKWHSYTWSNGVKYNVKWHIGSVSDETEIKKLWKKYNCSFSTARWKYIPKIIFRSKREKIAEFLSVLFAGDWSCYKDKYWKIWLSYSSTSYLMIKQVRHLLLRFWVDMRLVTKTTNFNTIAYELIACEVNTLQKFYKDIWIACKRKNDILKEINNKIVRNSRYSRSALRFTNITSIKSLGKQQVYDLSIEGTHNFIVDDTLVHNTAFWSNMQLALAYTKEDSYFISLEMTPVAMARKFLQMSADIKMDELETVSESILNRAKLGMDNLKELWIYLFDNCGLISYQIIEDWIRDAINNYGMRVVFVDYLQYFPLEWKNRTAEVGDLVNKIKQLAMELEITIVLMTQLNRSWRSKQKKGLYIPSLTDLKDSSTLEQSADSVIFICRDNESPLKCEQRKTVVKVAKNREGKTWYFSANFEWDTWIFSVETERDYLEEAENDSGTIEWVEGDDIFK